MAKGTRAVAAGYSIGQWIDEDGDGKYDVIEVETRHFKGPRALDPAGTPTHVDNEFVVKERLFFSKTDPKSAQRDHADRPCLHAPLDGVEELRSRASQAAGLAREQLPN